MNRKGVLPVRKGIKIASSRISHSAYVVVFGRRSCAFLIFLNHSLISLFTSPQFSTPPQHISLFILLFFRIIFLFSNKPLFSNLNIINEKDTCPDASAEFNKASIEATSEENGSVLINPKFNQSQKALGRCSCLKRKLEMAQEEAASKERKIESQESEDDSE